MKLTYTIRTLLIVQLLVIVFVWWIQPTKIKTGLPRNFRNCSNRGVWIYPKFGCKYFGYVDSGREWYLQWTPNKCVYPYAIGYSKNYGLILQKASKAL